CLKLRLASSGQIAEAEALRRFQSRSATSWVCGSHGLPLARARLLNHAATGGRHGLPRKQASIGDPPTELSFKTAPARVRKCWKRERVDDSLRNFPHWVASASEADHLAKLGAAEPDHCLVANTNHGNSPITQPNEFIARTRIVRQVLFHEFNLVLR